MNSSEVRTKYLDFFKKRGHAEIPAAPLVLATDPTTLFTSSGMQPLVPYLLGESHPQGQRLVDSQPSFRSQDIEEVGDNRHMTFFEMLGNWSLGDYFKKEQLRYIFEFLTDTKEGLGIDPQRLFVSVFSGDQNFTATQNPDIESTKTWQELFSQKGIAAKVANDQNEKPDISNGRIFYYGVQKNWWSRSGIPEKMPVSEIGGPDSEIFYDFGTELGIHEKSQWRNEPCHPNCDCGRFMEIGNSVFIQYKKVDDKTFAELPQKNVDFGGGLERMVAAVNNESDVFKTDLFWPIIETLSQNFGKRYGENPNLDKTFRIIADHIKAATFLIKNGVVPGNKLQGYTLRRLLRRAIVKTTFSKDGTSSALLDCVDKVIQIYSQTNYFQPGDQELIKETILGELNKFQTTLDKGLKEIEKIQNIDGKTAFNLYQTYGFPLEITEELFLEKGQSIDHEQFQREFEKHKELSRTSSAGMFKGGLSSQGVVETKYHTATHLLQAALRQILGTHVSQKGSHITAERLRFDFSHPQRLTPEEIEKVQSLVNQKIKENLPVTKTLMSKKEALASGAMANFTEKYGDQVNVYSIGNFSKELCGGPHVEQTGELGNFVITKEESVGAGVRRIYGELH